MKKIYTKFKHSIVKNKFYNVLTPILIVIFLLSGYKLISHKSPINKAELAYIDHSPAGANGGSVMPASCDSYPAHSTCQCNPNTQPPTTFYTPPSPSSCTFSNGVGKVMTHCQGGESWTWVIDSCTISICNPGFDPVTDSAGTRCQANCTGNNYRTYTTTQTGTRCIEYSDNWPFNCVDSEPVYSTAASCSPCTSGTVPNANHTSCVTPAVPSVNINLGN